MNKTPIPQNHYLTLGRLVYGLLFGFCIAIFVSSLSYKFVQGTAACDSIYNATWNELGPWCVEWFAAIKNIGLTPSLVEGYFLTLRLVDALFFFGFSLALMWRSGRDKRTLLLAAFLLVIGIAGTWFNPFWGWSMGWFDLYAPYPPLNLLPKLLTFFLMGGTILFACLFPNGRFTPSWSFWFAITSLFLLISNIFFQTAISAGVIGPPPFQPLFPSPLRHSV